MQKKNNLIILFQFPQIYFLEHSYLSMKVSSNRNTLRQTLVEDTIKSKTTELSTPIKLAIKFKAKSKKQRQTQLKYLLMLSLIKLYNRKYNKPPNYSFITASSQQNSQEQAYLFLQFIQKAIIKQFQRLKPQKQNMNTSQCCSFTSNYNSKMIGTTTLRFKTTCQYQHESSQFQKLNNIIDKSGLSNNTRKSLEYLFILKQLCQKIRIIIFKYYKSIISINDPQKLQNIRQYFYVIVDLFTNIHHLFAAILNQDQNFMSYQEKFKVLEKKINQKDTVFHHLQNLLFYFNNFYILRDIYQKYVKFKQVSYKNIAQVKKIVSLIIKLRHVLGYLSKEIINLSLLYDKEGQGKGSEENDLYGRDMMVNKMFWKKIYEKKYQTNNFRNRLKLQ